MRPVGRHGFTLMELIVAITLTAVVLLAIQKTVVMSQRATAAQVQRMNLQQNVRGVGFYLSHVLRELDASEDDVALATSSKIRFRSMRWSGILCSTPVAAGANVSFVVRRSLQQGLRAPDNSLDSILLFRELDPTRRADDRWLVGTLVSAASGVCLDGSSGRSIVVEITGASGGNPAALAGVTVGAPLRGFQMEELTLYPDGDGSYWLGQRTASNSGGWTDYRPVVGPLTADGLEFAYFDANGDVTGVATDIASVGLVVRGRSHSAVRVGNRSPAYLRDSIATRIALRNNVRF